MLHSVAFQGHSRVLSFSGGAPLRGDPRLIAVIPVWMKAEELSSEIVSQNIMSIPNF